jgi:hypothetical protein
LLRQNRKIRVNLQVVMEPVQVLATRVAVIPAQDYVRDVKVVQVPVSDYVRDAEDVRVLAQVPVLVPAPDINSIYNSSAFG